MNYWQHTLLSNYQQIVYKSILFVKFWQTAATFTWCFFYQQGGSERQQFSHRFNHCPCMEQWVWCSLLIYFNCHTYSSVCRSFHSCWQIRLTYIVVIYLFLCSWQLVVCYYHYLMTNDDHDYIKAEEAGSCHWVSLLAGIGYCFSHHKY